MIFTDEDEALVTTSNLSNLNVQSGRLLLILCSIIFVIYGAACSKKGIKDQPAKKVAKSDDTEVKIPPKTDDATLSENPTISGSGTLILKIPGEGAGTLTASLYDSNGEKSGMTITPEPQNPGTWRYSSIDAGVWRMIIQWKPENDGPVQSMAFDPVQIKPDETTILAPSEVPLSGTIRGKVETWGGQIAGLRITVDGTPFETKSNQEGAWEIKELPPGEFSVRYSYDQHGQGLHTGVKLEAGEEKVLDPMILLPQSGAVGIETRLKSIDKVDGKFHAQLVTSFPKRTVARRSAASVGELSNAPWESFSSTFVGIYDAVGSHTLVLQYQIKDPSGTLTESDSVITTFSIVDSP